MKYCLLAALPALAALALLQPAIKADEKDAPPPARSRVPWTTSHITGSPEPPHPYRIERVFPKLTFKNPLLLTSAPGTERLFVGEQAGKIWSFPKDPNVAKPDLFFDANALQPTWDKTKVRGLDALYGLTFHPQFAKNRYCYICYVLAGKNPGGQLEDGSRVARFRVGDTDPPRVDLKSEKVLLTFLGGGHNGGDLHFGPDGFLYISTGDGTSPNPPDARNTGQDISDLESSILRIDVDHAEGGKPYKVPEDNPFVKTPGARPEVWAYGFRNPWRMGFDRVTGDLWVGDVGWELWEMVYRVQRGGNYGWSIMEGPQPVHPDGKRGPTPILPPNLSFPHTEAISITGGRVYRGKKLKDLVGAYLCGDWGTRKLWATRFDGDKVVWHKEIAAGSQRVVAFGEDHDGELYFLHYDDAGSIHQLVPNEAANERRPPFPRRLSETGLFSSVKEYQPAPGVLPFAVNAAQWMDHATAERFVGLPETTQARIFDTPVGLNDGGFYSGQVFFPKDGVLVRTISMEMERGNPASRRRLETQVLHYDGTIWRGYSYRWNDEQTDAELVPSAGADQALVIRDTQAPGGRRKQTWHFPSRAECATCHNPWAGPPLAFTPANLNRDQLRDFSQIGLVRLFHRDDATQKDRVIAELPSPHLTNPDDTGASLGARARSYLHVNCAHCHQFGAGGTADIEMRYDVGLDQMKTLEVRPAQGTFEIPEANLIAPGDPYRSVLYYRMSKLGRGRMPHLGSEVVDERGLRLIHDWIRQLPPQREARRMVERLCELAGPGREQAVERSDLIKRLLASPTSALVLVRALDEGRTPASVRADVLTASLALPDASVRDLFERFLPDEQRVKRLGTTIRPEQVLSLKGNVERGRELFKAEAMQCIKCHRIGNTGSTLGPDLSQIGKKMTRAQILENILEPSKNIDPPYITYVVEMTNGKLVTGLLVKRTDDEVVIKSVGDKEERVPAKLIASLVALKFSLMPEQLLRDLTAEQAADLVDFLASLK